MKWLVVLTYLNSGLVFICFGQMAAVNECNTHLQNTFFYGGAIGIGLAVLITVAAVFAAVVEFVRKRLKPRRVYAKASQT